MPGFGDTALIALIALLLFGPKKLPVLARQLGKLMAEFRRASNEFRSQMEEELRIAEQADRQKEVAALEAASANKIAPPAEADSAPHTPPPAPNFTSPEESDRVTETQAGEEYTVTPPADVSEMPTAPIASSGDLNMMPPETGLPMARSNGAASSNASPASDANSPATAAHEAELETETLHG